MNSNIFQKLTLGIRHQHYGKSAESFKIKGTLVHKEANHITLHLGDNKMLEVQLKGDIEGEIGETVVVDKKDFVKSKLYDESDTKVLDEISEEESEAELLRKLDIPVNETTKNALTVLEKHGMKISKENIQAFVSAKEHLEQVVEGLDYDTAIKLLKKNVDISEEALQKLAVGIQEVKGEKEGFSLRKLFMRKKELSTEDAEKISMRLYGSKMGKDIIDTMKALHKAEMDITKKNIHRIHDVIRKVDDLQDIKEETIIDAVKNKIDATVDYLYKLKNAVVKGKIQPQKHIGQAVANLYETTSYRAPQVTEKDLRTMEEDIRELLAREEVKATEEAVRLSKDFVKAGLDLTKANIEKVQEIKEAIKELKDHLNYEKTAELLGNGIEVEKEEITELVKQIKESEDEKIKRSEGTEKVTEEASVKETSREMIEEIKELMKSIENKIPQTTDEKALHELKKKVAELKDKIVEVEKLKIPEVAEKEKNEMLQQLKNIMIEVENIRNQEDMKKIQAEKISVEKTEGEKEKSEDTEIEKPLGELVEKIREKEIEVKNLLGKLEKLEKVENEKLIELIKEEKSINIKTLMALVDKREKTLKFSKASEGLEVSRVSSAEARVVADTSLRLAKMLNQLKDLKFDTVAFQMNNKLPMTLKTLSTSQELLEVREEVQHLTEKSGETAAKEVEKLQERSQGLAKHLQQYMKETVKLPKIAMANTMEAIKSFIDKNGEKLGLTAENKDIEAVQALVKNSIPLSKENIAKLYETNLHVENITENLTTTTVDKSLQEGLQLEEVEVKDLAEYIENQTVKEMPKEATQEVAKKAAEEIKEISRETVKEISVEIDKHLKEIKIKAAELEEKMPREAFEAVKEAVAKLKVPEIEGKEEKKILQQLKDAIVEVEKIKPQEHAMKTDEERINVEKMLTEVVEKLEEKEVIIKNLLGKLEKLEQVESEKSNNIKTLKFSKASEGLEVSRVSSAEARVVTDTSLRLAKMLNQLKDLKFDTVAFQMNNKLPMTLKTLSTSQELLEVREEVQHLTEKSGETAAKEVEKLQERSQGLAKHLQQYMKETVKLPKIAMANTMEAIKSFIDKNGEKLGLTAENKDIEAVQALVKNSIPLSKENIAKLYETNLHVENITENLTTTTVDKSLQEGLQLEEVEVKDLAEYIENQTVKEMPKEATQEVAKKAAEEIKEISRETVKEISVEIDKHLKEIKIKAAELEEKMPREAFEAVKEAVAKLKVPEIEGKEEKKILQQLKDLIVEVEEMKVQENTEEVSAEKIGSVKTEIEKIKMEQAEIKQTDVKGVQIQSQKTGVERRIAREKEEVLQQVKDAIAEIEKLQPQENKEKVDVVETIDPEQGKVGTKALSLGFQRLEMLERLEKIEMGTLIFQIKNQLPMTIEALELSQKLLQGEIEAIEMQEGTQLRFPKELPLGTDIIIKNYLKENTPQLGAIAEEKNIKEVIRNLLENNLSLNRSNLQKVYQFQKHLEAIKEGLTTDLLEKIEVQGMTLDKILLKDLRDFIEREIPADLLQEENVLKDEMLKGLLQSMEGITYQQKDSILSLLLKNAIPVTLKEVQNLSFFLGNQQQIGYQMKEILKAIEKSPRKEIKEVAFKMRELLREVDEALKVGKIEGNRPYEEFGRLLKQLETKTHLLDNESKTSLQKSGEKLLDSLEIQMHLNKEDTVLQLPVMMGDQLKNLQIYIMKDKKGSKKIDPRDMSILLNFDTNTMGNVNVYVGVNYKRVVMKMGLNHQEDQQLIAKYENQLKELLQEMGYELKDLSFRVEEEQHILTMADEVATNEKRKKSLLDVKI
ncbi:DUF6240 domain-containing protein [Clostridium formicaceticum]|uniref:Flagellar hook-length control protein-like C-terminal domain-containing protein n=1 Tax=Clostridium formicaceticum TaxID=1497 RepID=A0AAC9WEU8_9CLOT|nr:DUF6240 domain-containing protein [Clostridium formicaceticum]AOY75703.1 hypothetical protein BJL90_07225 [Clostridium formicaceticum]ARE86023.1 hypothetical protein CLFO_03390 [Clostridium formicaceticum]